LEAGDVFGRSVQIEQKKAKLSIEAMAKMGYDAYNLGTRELIFGQEFIKSRMASSGIPLLCANVMLTEEGVPFAAPYIIKDLGGVRVGILGLMSNLFIGPRHKPEDKAISVKDYREVASELIPEIKKQCQIVIVLGHLTLEEAGELAEKVPGISAIILAWGMGAIDPPLEHKGTLILSDGTQGTHLGELYLEIGPDGKLLSHDSRLTPLDKKIPNDPEIISLLAAQGFPFSGPNEPQLPEGEDSKV
jgi:2',3'-cyclic-nucleotide 2'-phosphodiesterase (5'-nucleotidase family)